MNDAPKHPIGLDPDNELASDHSPIDPRDFRSALGTYATGVTIITAAGPDGKPYGLPCNSSTSVSLNPPLVLGSLVLYSSSLNAFQNASHFAVNVLGESQQALANKFAKSSEDKFSGVDWKPGLGGAPLIAESVANFQCRAVNRYYGGDHVIFLGAVEGYSYNRSEPLLFARGGYGGGVWPARPGAGGRVIFTIAASRCCLRAGAMAGSLPLTAGRRTTSQAEIAVRQLTPA